MHEIITMKQYTSNYEALSIKFRKNCIVYNTMYLYTYIYKILDGL